MITIKCGQSSYNETNVDVDATITINDDASATEVLYAIVKAMKIEGYSVKSIDNIIKKIASNLDDDYNIYNTYDILSDMIYD